MIIGVLVELANKKLDKVFDYKVPDNLLFEQYLLQSVAQSFASKLYVEKTFLHK